MASAVLGIDVGTSALKAIVVDADGRVLGRASAEYPLHVPRPLWSEQDPDDWWSAACTAVPAALADAGLDGAAIAAVGLAGQMHGLVALDGADRPVHRAILWNDQRCAAECAELERRLGRAALIAMAGKPALPSFTAPKILWLQRHEPATHARIARIGLPKDYVRLRLSGTLACDVADGSGTLLLDVRRRAWSDELLAACGATRAWLPSLHEGPEVCAAVSAAGAAATGLRAGTPIVAGAGDQAADGIGCGVVREGMVNLSIGTSGVAFAAASGAEADPTGALHLYCHAVPGAWHWMGVMLSAGGSLRWFRDALAPELAAQARAAGRDPYDVLLAEAAKAPVGAEGLVFLPYLSGERTPHADPEARGALVGLTLSHDRARIVRAVVEGITFGLRDCLELLRARGIVPKRVRVTGGAARSAWWRQMLADALGVEIATVNATEGAAFGAALLAVVGGGLRADVSAASAAVAERDVVAPGAEHGAYEAPYRRFRELYPRLAPTWRTDSATAGG